MPRDALTLTTGAVADMYWNGTTIKKAGEPLADA
jgi:hypothetical protein